MWKSASLNAFFFCFVFRRHASVHRRQRPPPPRPADVHPLPDARAGEGVPHESLPHAAAPDRDGAPAVPDGAADQDLVPEQEDEAQEGDPGHQGAQRAGEAGAGGQGSSSHAGTWTPRRAPLIKGTTRATGDLTVWNSKQMAKGSLSKQSMKTTPYKPMSRVIFLTFLSKGDFVATCLIFHGRVTQPKRTLEEKHSIPKQENYNYYKTQIRPRLLPLLGRRAVTSTTTAAAAATATRRISSSWPRYRCSCKHTVHQNHSPAIEFKR